VCFSGKKIKAGFERIEEGLAIARAAIYEAIRSQNSSSYKKGSYVSQRSHVQKPICFSSAKFQ